MKLLPYDIFKPISGYEDLYEVSNMGRVKSLNYHRTGQEMIMKPGKNKKGYLIVHLFKGKKVKTFKVHRLVAQAFISNPDNLPQVNHKDENKTNNHISNLEWCDCKYNINYGTHNERISKALTNGKRSKPVAQKTKDGEVIKIWPSVMEVERQTGWNIGNISECCSGERKSAYGFKWSYIHL